MPNLCLLYSTSEKGKKSLHWRMAKGLCFDTNMWKPYISRLLDLFSLSQLAFWSPLLGILKWIIACSRLFFCPLPQKTQNKHGGEAKGGGGCRHIQEGNIEEDLFPVEVGRLGTMLKMCIPKQNVVCIWKTRNNCCICWKLFIEQQQKKPKQVEHLSYGEISCLVNNIPHGVTVMKSFIYSHCNHSLQHLLNVLFTLI